MEVAKVAAKGTVHWLHVRQLGEKMPINVTVTDPSPKTKDGYEYIILYPSMASPATWECSPKSTMSLEARRLSFLTTSAYNAQFISHLLDALSLLKLTNVETSQHSLEHEVERAKRELIRLLKYIVYDRPIIDAWDTVLGMDVGVINTASMRRLESRRLSSFRRAGTLIVVASQRFAGRDCVASHGHPDPE